jgi:hypothetical protein
MLAGALLDAETQLGEPLKLQRKLLFLLEGHTCNEIYTHK